MQLSVNVPAITLKKVVDATGAGDAFLGGLIAGLWHQGIPKTVEELECVCLVQLKDGLNDLRRHVTRKLSCLYITPLSPSSYIPMLPSRLLGHLANAAGAVCCSSIGALPVDGARYNRLTYSPLTALLHSSLLSVPQIYIG